MPSRIDNILQHIVLRCGKIKSTIKRWGDDIGIFLGDEDYQQSASFNLIQIGELVKKLPMDFREQNPQIPWKQICGLRDIVVHTYGDVNQNTIFEICHDNIDELLDFCERQLQSSEESEENDDESQFEP